MALLITGAMGHVGYEVARQAAAAGDRVVAPYRNTFRVADADALRGSVEWVRCDLGDAAAVKALAEGRDIDACLHLAAVSNEAYARPDPLAAIRANVDATANLLDAARRHGWRRFVLTGTGSVFQAEADVARRILEDAPTSAVSIYGTTKLCAERLCAMYRSQFGLSAATVRISWVYGPPIVAESPTRGPIPGFLRKALMGIPIREASGADFAAMFTYVGDAAAGLLAAARAPELASETYHLGPGTNFTIAEVAAAVRAAVPGAVVELGPGTEPWTTYTRMRGPLAGDRLRRDTGFAVTRSLAAGIGAYADWMRAHPESLRPAPGERPA